jgi:hypothetical protein
MSDQQTESSSHKGNKFSAIIKNHIKDYWKPFIGLAAPLRMKISL